MLQEEKHGWDSELPYIYHKNVKEKTKQKFVKHLTKKSSVYIISKENKNKKGRKNERTIFNTIKNSKKRRNRRTTFSLHQPAQDFMETMKVG